MSRETHHPRSAAARVTWTIALATAVSLGVGATAFAGGSAGGTCGAGTGDCPKPPGFTVTKTATPTFTRTFDWGVAKRAEPPTAVTTAADTATFSYVVDVTKSAPTDSDFRVAGTITVTNDGFPNFITVTDEIVGVPEAVCTVTGGSDVFLSYGEQQAFPYSCTLPAGVPGTNRATVKWDSESVSTTASFSFDAPSVVVNDTVDVTDSFDGGAPAILVGGESVGASTSLSYTRTIAVPASGCRKVPNLAGVVLEQGGSRSAGAEVEVCRQTPSPPPPPPAGFSTPPAAAAGTPQGTAVPTRARLAITKSGPATATAGQAVTYRIRVHNPGRVPARAVRLRDVLPGGFALARRVPGASVRGGAITWNVGTLAPGRARTFAVTIRIVRTVGGRRCNSAVASAENATSVRAVACTRIAAVAGAVEPAVTG